MTKKSLKSESKGSGPKRKSSSNETDVGMEEKSKKTKIEEAPLHVPDTQAHKDVEATVPKKKKKKEKQFKIAEQPSLPADTCEGGEEEDMSPEEERFLERKLKKILKKEEINRLRAEGKWVTKAQKRAALRDPVAPKHALDYLTCWEKNREEWKFQKTRQTWLLQHMYDSEKIPDENFSVLLSYLEGIRGVARDTTILKAETLVRELGEGPLDENCQKRVSRAREVIQLLG